MLQKGLYTSFVTFKTLFVHLKKIDNRVINVFFPNEYRIAYIFFQILKLSISRKIDMWRIKNPLVKWGQCLKILFSPVILPTTENIYAFVKHVEFFRCFSMGILIKFEGNPIKIPMIRKDAYYNGDGSKTGIPTSFLLCLSLVR